MFSSTCRSILLKTPVGLSLAAHKTENEGYFPTDVTNIIDYLCTATTQFFESLPVRLTGTSSFVSSLLQFDLPAMVRFCRGLTLCDSSYVGSPTKLARLWVHEALREFLDRLPPCSARRHKVLRQLSTAFASLPLEDSNIAALQVSKLMGWIRWPSIVS